MSGGFELRRANEKTDAADIAKVFSKANLEGKQIWYFTAPASLSLTVETKFDIPIDRAEKDMPILTHGGNDYSMSFGDSVVSNAIKIMVPNSSGDKYSFRRFPSFLELSTFHV